MDVVVVAVAVAVAVAFRSRLRWESCGCATDGVAIVDVRWQAERVDELKRLRKQICTQRGHDVMHAPCLLGREGAGAHEHSLPGDEAEPKQPPAHADLGRNVAVATLVHAPDIDS